MSETSAELRLSDRRTLGEPYGVKADFQLRHTVQLLSYQFYLFVHLPHL